MRSCTLSSREGDAGYTERKKEYPPKGFEIQNSDPLNPPPPKKKTKTATTNKQNNTHTHARIPARTYAQQNNAQAYAYIKYQSTGPESNMFLFAIR